MATRPRQNNSSQSPITNKIPADIQRLIQNHQIDYSAAAEYWAKRADLVPERVSQLMKQLGRRYYRLDPEFGRYFRQHLQQWLHQQSVDGPTTAPDWVAFVLWSAGCTFKRDTQRLLRRREVWPRERSVRDAWVHLENLTPIKGAASIVYEWSEGDLQLPETTFEHPRVRITDEFSYDRAELPKLTIQFEGELIALVHRATYDIPDLDERERVRTHARELMDALFTKVMKNMQLIRQDANRPRDLETGGKAARLHDLDGLSWREVAKRLCREEHTHNKACAQRMRQAATRWYEDSGPSGVPIVKN
jgi:hypothetical protein